MPISYSCPHCGKQFTVADEYAGQTGPCAACGQTITIPGSPAGYPGKGYNYAPRASGGAGAGTVAVIVVLVVLLLMCPCGIALLLPAVQAAREAARRSQSQNNLKQIGLALHNYHDTHGEFPPAVVTDENGQPLYSGRVLLLPFLEQKPLFDAFDKSQAWDSPANQALSQTMLPTFVDPSAGTPQAGQCNYAFLTGQGAIFQAGQPSSMADITDGTANTIAVMEVQQASPSWAAPGDLDIGQMGGSMPPGNHPGGNLVLMADGSVRFIAKTINPQTLQALSTRDGQEAVNAP